MSHHVHTAAAVHWQPVVQKQSAAPFDPLPYPCFKPATCSIASLRGIVALPRECCVQAAPAGCACQQGGTNFVQLGPEGPSSAAVNAQGSAKRRTASVTPPRCIALSLSTTHTGWHSATFLPCLAQLQRAALCRATAQSTRINAIPALAGISRLPAFCWANCLLMPIPLCCWHQQL